MHHVFPLSTRFAASGPVRAVLVRYFDVAVVGDLEKHYGIAPPRPEAAGFGMTRLVASNATSVIDGFRNAAARTGDADRGT
jgi:hypothetical protein